MNFADFTKLMDKASFHPFYFFVRVRLSAFVVGCALLFSHALWASAPKDAPSQRTLEKYAEFAWIAIQHNQAIYRKALSCLEPSRAGYSLRNEPFCQGLVDDFNSKILPNYREMRVALSLAKPRLIPESEKLSESEKTEDRVFKIHPHPTHTIGYLTTGINQSIGAFLSFGPKLDLPPVAKLPPLTESEIKEALSWYQADKDLCLSQFDAKIEAEMPNSGALGSDLKLNKMIRLNRQGRFMYTCREQRRRHYNDVYLGLIEQNPILAFIEPRESHMGLDVIDYLLALEKIQLVSEQLVKRLSYESKENGATELAFDLLTWRSLLIHFVELYPHYSIQARELAQVKESQVQTKLLWTMGSMIAGGVACSLIARKLPGAHALIGSVSTTALAACNLAFGLGVNLYFVNSSFTRSGKEFLGVLSTPQGQMLGEEIYSLQKINQLEESEGELLFDFLTIGIGTGLAEAIIRIKNLSKKLSPHSAKFLEGLLKRESYAK